VLLRQLNESRFPLTSLLVLAAGALASCSPEQPPPGYLARVDRTELSEQDLRRTLDVAADSPQRRRDYIHEWILTEMLYQEAVKRGKADTDDARRQMELIRKRLAIAALLDDAVYAAVDTTDISDQDVASYLQRSGEELVLREDVARVSIATFATRDAANAFRALLLGGTAWDDAVRVTQSDTSAAPLLDHVEPLRYHTRASLYPEDLWKLAVTLRPGEVSFPAKITDGFAVVLTHGVRRVGEAPEFDYVRDEVRSRILIDLRRQRYEQYIQELRSRYRVDVRADVADTTQREP
jgi:hypothetical protein